MSQPPGFTPPPGRPVRHLTEQPDEPLDEALRESFPASDPIAVDGKAHPHGKRARPHGEKLQSAGGNPPDEKQ